MGHPAIYNRTPFLFEALFLNDPSSQPVLVGLLKASFRIQDKSEGPLIPLPEQVALKPAGEFNGAPEFSSYRYEPEVVPPKPLTDIVLIATARAPQPDMSSFEVGIRIGDVVQRATVFGDRIWLDGAGTPQISSPKPLDSLPLTYEHAFGGTDAHTLICGTPAVEARNPVGVGYHHPSSKVRHGDRLPNIEHPTQRISGYYDTPEPIGFGFTSPHWQPRARYAGTYDEAWATSRKPWLPVDFDTRFHNAASSGLVLESRLTGQEPVRIVHASPMATLEFMLPGLPDPFLHVLSRSETQARQVCELDTIVIDTDEMLLILYYRASLPVPTGVHDVAKIGMSMHGFDRGEHLKSLK